MKSYIKGVGLQNFKVFSSYQYFDFEALTVLVGRNGSGKSTYMQAVQFLIRYLNSVGEYLYFADDEYKMTLNYKATDEETIDYFFSSAEEIINDKNQPLLIDVVFDYAFESVYLVDVVKLRFVFHYSQEAQNLVLNELIAFRHGTEELLFRNNLENPYHNYNISFTPEGTYFLLQSFFTYLNAPKWKTQLERLGAVAPDTAKKSLQEELNEKFGPLKQKLWKEAEQVEFGHTIQNFTDIYDAPLPAVAIFSPDVRDCFPKCSVELDEVLNHAYQALKSTFLELINKLRNHQTFRLSDIDFPKRAIEKDSKLSRWAKDFEPSDRRLYIKYLIAFEFYGVPNLRKIPETNLYKVILVNKEETVINVKDAGSGYWNLTALLYLLFHPESKGQIILIEEPELNLHPNFQALLADLFIEAAQHFDQQLLIETHSEYLVRRLQRRIAEKNVFDKTNDSVVREHITSQNPYAVFISNGEVSMNYIEKREEGNQVINLGVDEYGELTPSIPAGFSDVATEEDLKNFHIKKYRLN